MRDRAVLPGKSASLKPRACNSAALCTGVLPPSTMFASSGTRDELLERKSPVALKLMRALKLALPPHGLLNPGRVL